MRNLKEYPIHIDEIVMRLNALAGESLDEERYGDLDALILQKAAEIVKAASGVLDGIDKRLSTKVDKFPDSIRWHTPWKEATDLVNAFKEVRRHGWGQVNWIAAAQWRRVAYEAAGWCG